MPNAPSKVRVVMKVFKGKQWIRCGTVSSPNPKKGKQDNNYISVRLRLFVCLCVSIHLIDSTFAYAYIIFLLDRTRLSNSLFYKRIRQKISCKWKYFWNNILRENNFANVEIRIMSRGKKRTDSRKIFLSFYSLAIFFLICIHCWISIALCQVRSNV